MSTLPKAPSEAKTSEVDAGLQFTPWSVAEELFRKQKAYFDTDATKTYEWRVDQLDRLVRMLKENYQRFADASRKDFKTASQENVFEVSAPIATSEFTKSQLKEWMKPVEAPLPKFLAKWCTGSHTGLRSSSARLTDRFCCRCVPRLRLYRPAIPAS